MTAAEGNHDWSCVGDAAELKSTGRLQVDIGGRKILLIHADGEHYACAAHCTHEHVELADGLAALGTIECPLHGAVFDLATGDVQYGPAEQPLPVYPCTVDGGRVWVQLKEK